MKTKRTLIAAIALTFTLGTVSLTMAHGPEQTSHPGNQMMHQNMMQDQNMMAPFSPEQQKDIDVIEAKYAADLASKETAMQQKGAELSAALNDDTTSLGTVKKLRSELAVLEQGYWQVRQEANQEIRTKIGINYRGNGTWGNENCAMHQSGHMMGQGMMMGGDMMAGVMQNRHCR